MNNEYFSIFNSVYQANIIVKIVLLILLLLSIYSWGVILNKISLIRKSSSLLMKLRSIVKHDKGDFNIIIDKFSSYKNNQYTGILKFFVINKSIIVVKNAVNQVVVDSVYNFLYDINLTLEKRVSTLATIGSSATFIGLFGTVVGIINTFTAISSTSSASLAIIAPGIAEALYATAFGLFVAIPAVFFYNILSIKIEKYKDEQNILLQEIIISFIKDSAFNNNSDEATDNRSKSLDLLQKEINK